MQPPVPPRPRYQACYCEENAWWLAREPAFAGWPVEVLLITNAGRGVGLAWQRAVPAGQLIVWDYHVVVCVAVAGRWWTYDPDTRIGFPVPTADFLCLSFPPLPARLRPRFRRLSREVYGARFASDRSHMRTAAGGWHAPPPPWPAIGPGNHLPALRDLRQRPEEVCGLAELHAFFAGAPR